MKKNDGANAEDSLRSIDICLKCECFCNKKGEYACTFSARDLLFYGTEPTVNQYESLKVPEYCMFKMEHRLDRWNRDDEKKD